MGKKTSSNKTFSDLASTLSYAFTIVILAVFPIFISKDYTNITRGKYQFFTVSSIAFLVLLFLSTITTSDQKTRKNAKINFSVSKILLLCYAGANILSALLSNFKDVENGDGKSALLFGMTRYNGLLTLITMLAVCIALAYAGGFKKIIPVLMSASLIVISIVGIIQLGGTNFLKLYPASKHNGYYHQFISTVGNIDFLASLFCVMIPLVLVATVIFDYKPIVRAVMLISASLGLYTTLQTKVDSVVVGMTAFVLVFVPVIATNKQWLAKGLTGLGFLALGLFGSIFVTYRYVEADKKTYTDFSFSALSAVVLLVGILLIVAGILFEKSQVNYNGKTVAIAIAGTQTAVILAAIFYLAFIYDVDKGSGLLKEIASFFQGKLTLHSGSRRIAIWKYSFELGLEHPVFGNGIGVFKSAFMQSKGDAYALLSDKTVDMAHNDYLQIFCDSGILGFGLYMGYLISTAIRAIKNLSKNSAIVILMLSAFCYLVQIFFAFNIVIVTPVFWAVMGLLENEITKAEENKLQV